MARDLRRYARQTSAQLLAGFLLILLVVGLGLIYIFLGPAAAVMGLMCVTGGLGVLALIFIVLWLMDWMVQKARQE